MLVSLLPEIGMLCSASLADLFSKGKVSYGLLDAKVHGIVPIWLVFAVQNLLDTFHITRNAAEKGLAEVRFRAHEIKKTIELYRSFSQSASHGETLLDRVYTFIKKWIDADRIGNLRRFMNPAIVGRHPHWLLTYHPMLCGAIIFYMNLSMQIAGRFLATASGAIAAYMHLYNASRQSGLNERPWWDMTFLIYVHRERASLLRWHAKEASKFPA